MPPVWKPIKKIIKKPIKWIGDRIEDVGDWVVDEIIDPIVNIVEGTIDAMLDDPIKTIATIALVVSGQAWALPLLEGADVAMNGGDIGDILEATAKAYVAQQVGAAVGSYAGSAAQGAAQASTSAATAKIVGQVVARGTANAVGAIVYGQDPAEAFLKGGIQAGVAAGLGKLAENTDFKNLPQAAKNVIETSLTAALTGEDITPAMIASAVTKAYVTTEAVGKYFDPSLNDDWDEEQMSSMSDGQIAAITNGILNTANAAFTGGDVPKAILDSVMKYGSQELNKIMDKTIKNTIDKVSGNYKTTEDKAQEIDDALDDYEAAAANYNVTADEMKPRFDERARLKGNVDELKVKLQNQDPGSNVDTANRDKYQAILNEYNASVKTYNSYATQLDNDYTNKYKPLLDKYKTEADTAYNNIEPLKKDYMKLKESLISSADQLDDALKPMQAATDKAFVTAMVGEDFNVEEYAKLNGLDDGGETGEEIDPYYHWLTTGKDEKLPTNKTQYDAQVKEQKQSLLQKSIDALGLSPFAVGKETLQKLQTQIDNNYGSDLDGLKNAAPETLAPDVAKYYMDEKLKNFNPVTATETYAKQKFSEKIPTFDSITFDQLKDIVGDPELKYISKTSQDTIFNTLNVPDMDIVSGNAAIDIDKEGNISWSKIDPTGGLGTYWDSVSNKMTSAKWDAEAKKYFKVDAKTNEVIDELDDYGENLSLVQPIVFSDLKKRDPTLYVETASKLSNEAGVALDAKEGAPISATAKTLFQSIFGGLDPLNVILTDKEKELAAGAVIEGTGTFVDMVNKIGMLTDTVFQYAVGGANAAEIKQAMDDQGVTFNVYELDKNAAKLAKNIIMFGTDLKPEELKKETKEFTDILADANIDKVEYFFDGRKNPNYGKTQEDLSVWDKAYNTTSVFFKNVNKSSLIDFVANELGESVGTLGFGNIIKYGASASIKNQFKELGKEVVDEFAKKFSDDATKQFLTSAETIEAFAYAGQGAYEQSYQEAIKQGFDPFKSHEIASNHGGKLGMAGILLQTATTKIFDANKVQKMMLGVNTKLSAKATNDLHEVFSSMAAEGTSEFFAEGGEGGYGAWLINKDINPEYDITSNATQSAWIGALTGTGFAGVTSAGVQANDFLTNVLANGNAKINNLFKNYDGTDESLNSVKTELFNLGIEDNSIKTNLLNVMRPSDFTTKHDILEATKNVSNVYTFQDNEIKQLENKYEGETSEEDFTFSFDTYVDEGTVDDKEVLALAASEGITLTPEQVAQLIGQKNEQTFLQEQQKIFDPQAVTKEEATKFLADQGYNPTEEEVLSFVAEVEESKQQAAIQKYSEDRLTTKDEAIAYLESLGLDTAQLPNEFIDQFVKQGLQTETEQQIKEAADPYYVDEQEVLDAYKAAGLPDVRPEDVQKLIGQYSESDLGKKLTKALGGAQYNVLKYNIGAPSTDDVPATGIFAELEKLQAEGASQSEAIAALSEKLNISVEDLKFQIQTVEAGLQEQIYEVGDQVAGVSDQLTQTEAKLTKQLQELVSAGATQDEAIQALSDKLGISVEDLNSQITGVETKLNQKITDVETGLTEQITDVETGLTEQITDVETGLTEQITDVETGLTSEITAIADIIGKPVGEVTDVDIDFITDLIAQQTALADPSTFEFTTDMLQYDVTGDGIVDIADQTMLQNAMQGQDVQFAQDSKFGPTGVFDTIADTKTDLTQQIKDSQQEITTMYQTDQAMQAQKAAEEKQKAALAKQRMGNLEQLYAAAQPQTVSAKQVELANIGPQYDFESIFRDTGQQSFYKTPYRKGGQVNEINDTLLKLIGGN
jgi:hypothetical protein